MIYSKNELENIIKDYKNPNDKISRLIKEKKLHHIIRGLYTDNENESGEIISQRILSPSYLSFEYALSYYQLIPETVFTYTLATCGKNKKKVYNTSFGTYIYYNVPLEIYRYGVKLMEIKDGKYFMATPCKAIIDILYKESPLRTVGSLKDYLFDNMRIDKDDFNKLDKNELKFLIDRMKCTNCKLLKKIL